MFIYCYVYAIEFLNIFYLLYWIVLHHLFLRGGKIPFNLLIPNFSKGLHVGYPLDFPLSNKLQSTSLDGTVVHVGYVGQGANGKIMHTKFLICC